MTAVARLGTVTVLLAAGLVVGQVTEAGPPPPDTPPVLPVVAATAVCPDVRQQEGRAATAVTVVGAASRTVGVLGQPARPLPAVPVVRDLAAPGVQGALVVRAVGPGSGDLVVEQATRTTGGSGRGVAALTCPAPATSSWFVGGATKVGSTAELLLVNTERTPASVDVRVWTADGPADPRPGRGLTVPPLSRLVVPLDRLAPDRDLLALHVLSGRGRVASALRVGRADGRTPLGSDWVAPGQPPATDLVVPGLPAGPGRRTALLTNPSDEDAAVSLELTTKEGQYVPTGLEAVEVPAGTSVAVDLSEQLAGTAAAMRVRSDGPPVLAGGMVVDRQEGPVREIAYAAATPGLSASARLADVRLSPRTDVTLVLSAVDDDSVVELVPLAAPARPQRLEVAAGTTVEVPLSRFLPAGATGSLALELRPVSGLVHAARYSREQGRRGPLTTVLPVLPARLGVAPPAVRPDPGAGL